jgi:UDP-glucose 4-epimerase
MSYDYVSEFHVGIQQERSVIGSQTAIITGAAGFIGSHLADRLIVEGWDVVGIDDLSSGKLSNLPSDIDLRVVDIRDKSVQQILSEVRPNIVFHLAAQISVSASVRAPQHDADVNIGGALNVLEGIRGIGGENIRFVYVTSGGTAYGEPEFVPADETTPVRPLSPYGASKLAVETYLPIYKRLSGMSYSIIRLANIYGPRQDPHGEAGVVAIFAKAMIAGKSLTIFGDGHDERDYVYVEDVVNAISSAASSSFAGPFNVGTGVGTSTNRIFELVASYCGHSTPAVHGPARAGDVNRISLDSSKAHTELGWAPAFAIEKGLERTVQWFKQNSD